MALQKKDENRVSAHLFGKLSLIVAVVLVILGAVVWKAGHKVVTSVDKSITDEKIYFPPEGAPGFTKETYPKAVKYAGKQVTDGKMAKIFAEDYLGVQMNAVGGGKTGSEVSAMAAADPQNASLQQLQTVMFQMGTSKNLLLSANAGWAQGKIMKHIGLSMFVLAAVLIVIALVQFGRYRSLR